MQGMELLQQKKPRRKEAKGVWKLSSCTDRCPYKPSFLTRLGKGGSPRGRGREKHHGFALKQDPPALRHPLQAGDRQSCRNRQAGLGRETSLQTFDKNPPRPPATITPSWFLQEPRALQGSAGTGRDGLTQTLHAFSTCVSLLPCSLFSPL